MKYDTVMNSNKVAYIVKSSHTGTQVCLDRKIAVDRAIELLGGRESLQLADRKSIGAFMEIDESKLSGKLNVMVGMNLHIGGRGASEVTVAGIELI